MRAAILILLCLLLPGCPVMVEPGWVVTTLQLPTSTNYFRAYSIVASFDWAAGPDGFSPYTDISTDHVPILAGAGAKSDVLGDGVAVLRAQPGELAGRAISLNGKIADKALTIDPADPLPPAILPAHRVRVIGIRLRLRGACNLQSRVQIS